VSRVESTWPDPVMGDTQAVTTYEDYRETGGIRFPMRIRQSLGGMPVLDLAVKEVQVNPALALAVPEAARNAAERVTSEKVARRRLVPAGGSHNSVLIELQDQLVLVEVPLNDARSQAVIDHAKGLVPGKPLRTVVNSHAHFDHAGGVRTAVAEGADDRHARRQRGLLRARVRAGEPHPAGPHGHGRAQAPRSGRRRTARHRRCGAADRPAQDRRRTAQRQHADGPPAEGEAADPGRRLHAGRAEHAAADDANANNVNLIDNIERLKLEVDRILPLHGRVVPVAELYAAAQRNPSR
jgi:glyoxylase-like metal-dependent hydrolase (beta-lactamase superfamily II)